jgi:hypothetical protein
VFHFNAAYVTDRASGFDFNLLFKKGIRYLSNEEEKYVREKEECALAGMLEDIHVEKAQAEFV